jgi:hypothetical protein
VVVSILIMPPKKSKGKGKKSKKTSEEREGGVGLVGADATAVAEEVKKNEPLEEEFVTKRLEAVKEQTYGQAKQIEMLKSVAKTRDEESKQMMHYLNQEMKRRDMVNTRLQRFYDETTQKASTDMKSMQDQFESKLRRAEAVFLQKEAQLLTKNQQLLQEVHDLQSYRQMREDLQNELNNTKQIIAENEARHKQQLELLEHKFLEAKEILQEQAAERVAHSRIVYKEEVGKELDYESRMVRKENRKLRKDLSATEGQSSKLMQSNEELHKSLKVLRMELSLSKQNEHEHNLRSARQLNQIKELTERTNSLEGALSQCLREFELEKESNLQQTAAEVAELTARFEELENLSRLKERELKMVRTHASALLSQRSEIETFLLEEITTTKRDLDAQKSLRLQNEAQVLHAQTRALAVKAPFSLASLNALSTALGSSKVGSQVGTSRKAGLVSGAAVSSTQEVANKAPLPHIVTNDARGSARGAQVLTLLGVTGEWLAREGDNNNPDNPDKSSRPRSSRLRTEGIKSEALSFLTGETDTENVALLDIVRDDTDKREDLGNSGTVLEDLGGGSKEQIGDNGDQSYNLSASSHPHDPESLFQQHQSGVVDVRDLSPEDRHLILKLLFSKIKRGPRDAIPTLPQHSFDVQLDSASRPLTTASVGSSRTSMSLTTGTVSSLVVARGTNPTGHTNKALMRKIALKPPAVLTRPRPLLWETPPASQSSTPRAKDMPRPPGRDDYDAEIM